jgi:hypothetical protein
MTLLGTTTLVLSLLAGAPESAPAQPQPQTRVEASKKPEQQPTGPIMMIGITPRGARFKVQGDVDKKIPFRLTLPVGKLIEIQFRDIKDHDYSEFFMGY